MLVEQYSFRQEAVLHDFVIDRSGRKNDLVIMTFDLPAAAGSVP